MNESTPNILVVGIGRNGLSVLENLKRRNLKYIEYLEVQTKMKEQIKFTKAIDTTEKINKSEEFLLRKLKNIDMVIIIINSNDKINFKAFLRILEVIKKLKIYSIGILNNTSILYKVLKFGYDFNCTIYTTFNINRVSDIVNLIVIPFIEPGMICFDFTDFRYITNKMSGKVKFYNIKTLENEIRTEQFNKIDSVFMVITTKSLIITNKAADLIQNKFDKDTNLFFTNSSFSKRKDRFYNKMGLFLLERK